MNCPLCKSDKIKQIEILNYRYLIKLYKKFTKIDFGYLIKQDISYNECSGCKLRFYDPLIVGDEKFYNSLQKFDWYYMNEKAEYLEVGKYIGENDTVLDVGSGKGAFAKCIPTKHYVGLDTSKNAKNIAQKEGIVVKNEMIQDFSKAHQNSFDVVVSFQVLEHVSDPDNFLKSKIKALKVGGKLIIAVPSEDSFLKYTTNSILNMPPHHITRWTDYTLEFIAQRYNLKLSKIYHESVQEMHRVWYVNTFIQNSIIKERVLDNSLVRKLVFGIAFVFTKILVKGAKKEFLANGHTVIAIYQK